MTTISSSVSNSLRTASMMDGSIFRTSNRTRLVISSRVIAIFWGSATGVGVVLGDDSSGHVDDEAMSPIMTTTRSTLQENNTRVYPRPVGFKKREWQHHVIYDMIRLDLFSFRTRGDLRNRTDIGVCVSTHWVNQTIVTLPYNDHEYKLNKNVLKQPRSKVPRNAPT